MANLAKVTINWTGFIGAPGFTNLYFRNATPGLITQAVVDNAVLKVDTWLNAWDDDLPTWVTTGVNANVEEINDTNGQLQAYWTAAPEAAIVGAAAGAASAVAGACVNWNTNTVRNGRRVRGRSFMVPIGSSGLSVGGTLADTRLAVWRTASTALHAATGDARLVVWSRPTTPGGTDGGSSEVVNATIADKAAILTSRRD